MSKNNQILDKETDKEKSKMSKGVKILLGFLMMFCGWLSVGIGYGIALPFELNTILFCGGLILFLGGLVFMFT